jgi:glycosyltransferase involved in cell wall biosynthesis
MSRPLNVTLCVGLAQGGIAHYSYSLASALQASGARTTALMYGHPEYDLKDFPHSYEVRRSLALSISRVSRVTSPLQNVAALARAARTADVVHFQWSLGARNDRMEWPLLRRLMRKPIVYTAHDVLPHEAAIMGESHARWIYHQADALIVHGEQLKQLMVERFDVASSKVHVIPLGNFIFMADTPGEWSQAAARASLDFGPRDRVVLFFGLIREYKGLDVLVEACRIVQARGLPAGEKLRLIIAGRDFRDHWREGRYESLIRDAGLSDSVSLHLRHIEMTEVARFFRASDVVAVPYRRGSQSGVLQLAYAFGKAAVATRVGSLSEVPSDGVTSFVEPGNAEALADELHRLLSNEDARERMGAAGRVYAERTLSWETIVEKTRRVYDSVLG